MKKISVIHLKCLSDVFIWAWEFRPSLTHMIWVRMGRCWAPRQQITGRRSGRGTATGTLFLGWIRSQLMIDMFLSGPSVFGSAQWGETRRVRGSLFMCLCVCSLVLTGLKLVWMHVLFSVPQTEMRQVTEISGELRQQQVVSMVNTSTREHEFSWLSRKAAKSNSKMKQPPLSQFTHWLHKQTRL